MGSPEVSALAQEALILTLKLSMPTLLIALFVGVVISLLQALTQIQEMTLSFVPKMLAIFVSLLFLMPILARWLEEFSLRLFQHMAGV